LALLAAYFTRLDFFFAVGRSFTRSPTVGSHWFGVPRGAAVVALQIFSKAAQLLNHARRVALQTNFFSRSFLLLDVFGVLLKLRQIVLEFVIEFVQRVGPLELAFFDFIQLVFH